MHNRYIDLVHTYIHRSQSSFKTTRYYLTCSVCTMYTVQTGRVTQYLIRDSLVYNITNRSKLGQYLTFSRRRSVATAYVVSCQCDITVTSVNKGAYTFIEATDIAS